MGRLVAVAAALMLVAGCGGDDDQKASTTPAPTETAAGTEATPTPTATPTVATGPVAQAEGSADGGRFVFVITDLKRSGPTIVLNATVSLAGDSPRDSIQISSAFSDGLYQDLEGAEGEEEGDVFDGVALIDPEGRKKYLVARDSTGRCVCSNDLSAAFVQEDAPVNIQATLAAPPESVTTVDVVVPSVKTFTGVSLAG